MMVSNYLLLALFLTSATRSSSVDPQPPSTLSPVLDKILSAVDSVTSDKNLLDVTLKFLQGICVCMQETLRVKKLQLNNENDVELTSNEDAKGTRKEVELYNRLYNNTCLKLRQELAKKFNTTINLDEDRKWDVTKCAQNFELTTEYIMELNTLPKLEEHVKTQMERVLHKSLVETRNKHKYNISIRRLFSKNFSQISNKNKQSMIVIITFNSKQFNGGEKDRNITESELSDVLDHTNTTIDIDVIDERSYHRRNFVGDQDLNISDCVIQSVYAFLIESGRNDKIKKFRLLRKNDNIKIYIDLIPENIYDEFRYYCCESRITNILCLNHTDIDIVENKLEKPILQDYKDTISRIINLVKLFENRTKYENNMNESGNQVQKPELLQWMEKLIKPASENKMSIVPLNNSYENNAPNKNNSKLKMDTTTESDLFIYKSSFIQVPSVTTAKFVMKNNTPLSELIKKSSDFMNTTAKHFKEEVIVSKGKTNITLESETKNASQNKATFLSQQDTKIYNDTKETIDSLKLDKVLYSLKAIQQNVITNDFTTPTNNKQQNEQTNTTELGLQFSSTVSNEYFTLFSSNSKGEFVNLDINEKLENKTIKSHSNQTQASTALKTTTGPETRVDLVVPTFAESIENSLTFDDMLSNETISMYNKTMQLETKHQPNETVTKAANRTLGNNKDATNAHVNLLIQNLIESSQDDKTSSDNDNMNMDKEVHYQSSAKQMDTPPSHTNDLQMTTIPKTYHNIEKSTVLLVSPNNAMSNLKEITPITQRLTIQYNFDHNTENVYPEVYSLKDNRIKYVSSNGEFTDKNSGAILLLRSKLKDPINTSNFNVNNIKLKTNKYSNDINNNVRTKMITSTISSGNLYPEMYSLKDFDEMEYKTSIGDITFKNSGDLFRFKGDIKDRNSTNTNNFKVNDVKMKSIKHSNDFDHVKNPMMKSTMSSDNLDPKIYSSNDFEVTQNENPIEKFRIKNSSHLIHLKSKTNAPTNNNIRIENMEQDQLRTTPYTKTFIFSSASYPEVYNHEDVFENNVVNLTGIQDTKNQHPSEFTTNSYSSNNKTTKNATVTHATDLYPKIYSLKDFEKTQYEKPIEISRIQNSSDLIYLKSKTNTPPNKDMEQNQLRTIPYTKSFTFSSASYPEVYNNEDVFENNVVNLTGIQDTKNQHPSEFRTNSYSNNNKTTKNATVRHATDFYGNIEGMEDKEKTLSQEVTKTIPLTDSKYFERYHFEDLHKGSSENIGQETANINSNLISAGVDYINSTNDYTINNDHPKNYSESPAFLEYNSETADTLIKVVKNNHDRVVTLSTDHWKTAKTSSKDGSKLPENGISDLMITIPALSTITLNDKTKTINGEKIENSEMTTPSLKSSLGPSGFTFSNRINSDETTTLEKSFSAIPNYLTLNQYKEANPTETKFDTTTINHNNIHTESIFTQLDGTFDKASINKEDYKTSNKKRNQEADLSKYSAISRPDGVYSTWLPQSTDISLQAHYDNINFMSQTISSDYVSANTNNIDDNTLQLPTSSKLTTKTYPFVPQTLTSKEPFTYQTEFETTNRFLKSNVKSTFASSIKETLLQKSQSSINFISAGASDDLPKIQNNNSVSDLENKDINTTVSVESSSDGLTTLVPYTYKTDGKHKTDEIQEIMPSPTFSDDLSNFTVPSAIYSNGISDKTFKSAYTLNGTKLHFNNSNMYIIPFKSNASINNEFSKVMTQTYQVTMQSVNSTVNNSEEHTVHNLTKIPTSLQVNDSKISYISVKNNVLPTENDVQYKTVTLKLSSTNDVINGILKQNTNDINVINETKSNLEQIKESKSTRFLPVYPVNTKYEQKISLNEVVDAYSVPSKSGNKNNDTETGIFTEHNSNTANTLGFSSFKAQLEKTHGFDENKETNSSQKRNDDSEKYTLPYLSNGQFESTTHRQNATKIHVKDSNIYNISFKSNAFINRAIVLKAKTSISQTNLQSKNGTDNHSKEHVINNLIQDPTSWHENGSVKTNEFQKNNDTQEKAVNRSLSDVISELSTRSTISSVNIRTSRKETQLNHEYNLQGDSMIRTDKVLLDDSNLNNSSTNMVNHITSHNKTVIYNNINSYSIMKATSPSQHTIHESDNIKTTSSYNTGHDIFFTIKTNELLNAPVPIINDVKNVSATKTTALLNESTPKLNKENPNVRSNTINKEKTSDTFALDEINNNKIPSFIMKTLTTAWIPKYRNNITSNANTDTKATTKLSKIRKQNTVFEHKSITEQSSLLSNKFLVSKNQTESQKDKTYIENMTKGSIITATTKGMNKLLIQNMFQVNCTKNNSTIILSDERITKADDAIVTDLPFAKQVLRTTTESEMVEEPTKKELKYHSRFQDIDDSKLFKAIFNKTTPKMENTNNESGMGIDVKDKSTAKTFSLLRNNTEDSGNISKLISLNEKGDRIENHSKSIVNFNEILLSNNTITNHELLLTFLPAIQKDTLTEASFVNSKIKNTSVENIIATLTLNINKKYFTHFTTSTDKNKKLNSRIQKNKTINEIGKYKTKETSDWQKLDIKSDFIQKDRTNSYINNYNKSVPSLIIQTKDPASTTTTVSDYTMTRNISTKNGNEKEISFDLKEDADYSLLTGQGNYQSKEFLLNEKEDAKTGNENFTKFADNSEYFILSTNINDDQNNKSNDSFLTADIINMNKLDSSINNSTFDSTTETWLVKNTGLINVDKEYILLRGGIELIDINKEHVTEDSARNVSKINNNNMLDASMYSIPESQTDSIFYENKIINIEDVRKERIITKSTKETPIERMPPLMTNKFQTTETGTNITLSFTENSLLSTTKTTSDQHSFNTTVTNLEENTHDITIINKDVLNTEGIDNYDSDSKYLTKDMSKSSHNINNNKNTVPFFSTHRDSSSILSGIKLYDIEHTTEKYFIKPANKESLTRMKVTVIFDNTDSKISFPRPTTETGVAIIQLPYTEQISWTSTKSAKHIKNQIGKPKDLLDTTDKSSIDSFSVSQIVTPTVASTSKLEALHENDNTLRDVTKSHFSIINEDTQTLVNTIPNHEMLPIVSPTMKSIIKTKTSINSQINNDDIINNFTLNPKISTSSNYQDDSVPFSITTEGFNFSNYFYNDRNTPKGIKHGTKDKLSVLTSQGYFPSYNTEPNEIQNNTAGTWTTFSNSAGNHVKLTESSFNHKINNKSTDSILVGNGTLTTETFYLNQNNFNTTGKNLLETIILHDGGDNAHTLLIDEIANIDNNDKHITKHNSKNRPKNNNIVLTDATNFTPERPISSTQFSDIEHTTEKHYITTANKESHTEMKQTVNRNTFEINRKPTIPNTLLEKSDIETDITITHFPYGTQILKTTTESVLEINNVIDISNQLVETTNKSTIKPFSVTKNIAPTANEILKNEPSNFYVTEQKFDFNLKKTATTKTTDFSVLYGQGVFLPSDLKLTENQTETASTVIPLLVANVLTNDYFNHSMLSQSIPTIKNNEIGLTVHANVYPQELNASKKISKFITTTKEGLLENTELNNGKSEYILLRGGIGFMASNNKRIIKNKDQNVFSQNNIFPKTISKKQTGYNLSETEITVVENLTKNKINSKVSTTATKSSLISNTFKIKHNDIQSKIILEKVESEFLNSTNHSSYTKPILRTTTENSLSVEPTDNIFKYISVQDQNDIKLPTEFQAIAIFEDASYPATKRYTELLNNSPIKTREGITPRAVSKRTSKVESSNQFDTTQVIDLTFMMTANTKDVNLTKLQSNNEPLSTSSAFASTEITVQSAITNNTIRTSVVSSMYNDTLSFWKSDSTTTNRLNYTNKNPIKEGLKKQLSSHKMKSISSTSASFSDVPFSYSQNNEELFPSSAVARTSVPIPDTIPYNQNIPKATSSSHNDASLSSLKSNTNTEPTYLVNRSTYTPRQEHMTNHDNKIKDTNNTHKADTRNVLHFENIVNTINAEKINSQMHISNLFSAIEDNALLNNESSLESEVVDNDMMVKIFGKYINTTSEEKKMVSKSMSKHNFNDRDKYDTFNKTSAPELLTILENKLINISDPLKNKNDLKNTSKFKNVEESTTEQETETNRNDSNQKTINKNVTTHIIFKNIHNKNQNSILQSKSIQFSATELTSIKPFTNNVFNQSECNGNIAKQIMAIPVMPMQIIPHPLLLPNQILSNILVPSHLMPNLMIPNACIPNTMIAKPNPMSSNGVISNSIMGNPVISDQGVVSKETKNQTTENITSFLNYDYAQKITKSNINNFKSFTPDVDKNVAPIIRRIIYTYRPPKITTTASPRKSNSKKHTIVYNTFQPTPRELDDLIPIDLSPYRNRPVIPRYKYTKSPPQILFEEHDKDDWNPVDYSARKTMSSSTIKSTTSMPRILKYVPMKPNQALHSKRTTKDIQPRKILIKDTTPKDVFIQRNPLRPTRAPMPRVSIIRNMIRNRVLPMTHRTTDAITSVAVLRKITPKQVLLKQNSVLPIKHTSTESLPRATIIKDKIPKYLHSLKNAMEPTRVPMPRVSIVKNMIRNRVLPMKHRTTDTIPGVAMLRDLTARNSRRMKYYKTQASTSRVTLPMQNLNTTNVPFSQKRFELITSTTLNVQPTTRRARPRNNNDVERNENNNNTCKNIKQMVTKTIEELQRLLREENCTSNLLNLEQQEIENKSTRSSAKVKISRDIDSLNPTLDILTRVFNIVTSTTTRRPDISNTIRKPKDNDIEYTTSMSNINIDVDKIVLVGRKHIFVNKNKPSYNFEDQTSTPPQGIYKTSQSFKYNHESFKIISDDRNLMMRKMRPRRLNQGVNKANGHNVLSKQRKNTISYEKRPIVGINVTNGNNNYSVDITRRTGKVNGIQKTTHLQSSFSVESTTHDSLKKIIFDRKPSVNSKDRRNSKKPLRGRIVSKQVVNSKKPKTLPTIGTKKFETTTSVIARLKISNRFDNKNILINMLNNLKLQLKTENTKLNQNSPSDHLTKTVLHPVRQTYNKLNPIKNHRTYMREIKLGNKHRSIINTNDFLSKRPAALQKSEKKPAVERLLHNPVNPIMMVRHNKPVVREVLTSQFNDIDNPMMRLYNKNIHVDRVISRPNSFVKIKKVYQREPLNDEETQIVQTPSMPLSRLQPETKFFMDVNNHNSNDEQSDLDNIYDEDTNPRFTTWRSGRVTDWWLNDMYLKVRIPLPINSNPGMVFPSRRFAKMEEVADLGALFIDDLLDYKEMLDRGELPLERATSREKGQPLCMEQFYRLLGVCRIPEVGKDRLEFPQVREGEGEELVVVACRNCFYAIPVKAADRGRLTAGEIQAQLLHAMVDAAGGLSAPKVGLLTSMNRDQWARAREILIRDDNNRHNLEMISRALCILCLDEDGGNMANDPETSSMLRAMHGAGTKYHSANRWFDKTVQLIISSDGTVGMCYEHSAAEGVAVVRLAERALARAEVSERPAPPPALLPAPQAMKWNLTPEINRTIEMAGKELDRQIANLDFKVYTYKGYGREFMKSCKTSPDVYIQLALQYAYYKMYGYLVSTYESASLRRFRNGRVDNIRSAHKEAKAWAATMCTAENSPMNELGEDGQKKVSFNLYGEQKKLELFEAAARKQTEIMEANILGRGIDNHLLGLREAARETLGELPSLFTDSTYKQMIEFKLSTSQVATTTEGTYMGYGAVVPDGYGCSYNPKKESIIFCISSFVASSVTNTEAFRQSLEEALDSMKLMFQNRKVEN